MSAAAPPHEFGELQRRLNSRQLTMIAIGGAIGVGLFLGSSFTIELAGPGIILSYLIGALIAVVMAYAEPVTLMMALILLLIMPMG